MAQLIPTKQRYRLWGSGAFAGTEKKNWPFDHQHYICFTHPGVVIPPVCPFDYYYNYNYRKTVLPDFLETLWLPILC